MRILASNSTFQYQLNLPGYSFQGPLDLLLQMIERRELPITEISLARIADEYVVYIEQLEEVHPAELADFLVVAARLLLIKSYALLPTPPVAITEAEEEQDTAEQLLSQLREYKRIKEAAEILRLRQEANLHAHTTRRNGLSDVNLRQVTAELERIRATAGSGLQGLKLTDMLALVRRRLAAQAAQRLKLPITATSQHLKELVRSVKIEDKIALIEERLKIEVSGQIEFTSLFDLEEAEPPSSLEVIVTFMGVLELLRRKQVQVEQAELFGEILIQSLQTNQPEEVLFKER
ncbi:MAG: segregation/condensation protein A [Chloroflexota bacterium]|nr:segregation/condensation protein A [Chloroflexota bacterium]